MLSFGQINWPGSFAAEWVINSRPDRNASGGRPYINNTPYVITLRLYIQFLSNSQIQLS